MISEFRFSLKKSIMEAMLYHPVVAVR
jgi:hypothetical protein